MNIDSQFLDFKKKTNSKLNKIIEEIKPFHPGLQKLTDATAYSLLGDGKRFRPLLSFSTAYALNSNIDLISTFASAIELVHTYSLIHDDLPSMDNSDFRRNKPTNHKVYGEDIALLSGDLLLTTAFDILSNSQEYNSELKVKLISILSSASGFRGMIGGQTLDLYFQKNDPDFAELEQLHILKTGALIRASILGASEICNATNDQKKELKKYSELLGLAFQISDDLLDQENINKNNEPNFIRGIGLEESKTKLKSISSTALDALKAWDSKADLLRELININLKRIY